MTAWELEHYRHSKVERNWMNWLSGYTIYVSMIIQAQSWRTSLALIKYLDIIHRAYSSFLGTTWVRLKWFSHYYHRVDTSYLAHRFTEGFCIPSEGQHIHVMSRNLKSAKGLEEMVRNNIKKKLEGGHLSDPHSSLLLPNVCISPLGWYPKRHQ